MSEQALRTYERRWWTLAVLSLALIVISLDNTILNVALPTLVRDLHATSSQLQWIVDSYVLVFAGLLLTAGALGDRFGRKLALMAGLGILGVGSALAAMSGSAEHLIATRALMGVGGALVMPSTLSILTNVFPPAERPKAIGIWAAVNGLSIPMGPVLGGWLLEHYWWGSVFLINIPVVVIAVIAAAILVPESRDAKALPLDPVGAVLSIAGLAALLYAIIEAPAAGWTSGRTIAWFAGAAVSLGAFVLWERRVPYPMFDTALFKNRRFSAASLSVTMVFFGLFGSTFFLTQHMQFVLGYDTLQTGVRMIPVALGIAVAAPLSARLTARFGAKVMVTSGLTIVALGLGLMSTATVTSGYGLVATFMIVAGAGMGLAMTPATDAVMGAVPKDNAGVGSAVNDTTRQVGGALGVAVLGSLLATNYRDGMRAPASALPPEVAKVARDSVGAALEITARLGDAAAAQALANAAKLAFVDAMDTTLLVGMAVTLLGAAIALLFLPARADDDGRAPEPRADEAAVLEEEPALV
ncbi:MAG: MFS transporter [Sphaerobacter sp.]|nr:MFS transporter [Sphaerobacter sp.]